MEGRMQGRRSCRIPTGASWRPMRRRGVCTRPGKGAIFLFFYFSLLAGILELFLDMLIPQNLKTLHWKGQCIGKRNYQFFFMFVSSTTMLCIYVFAFCWVNLRKIMDTHECKLGRAILKSPISGILILYTFIAVWFVGGLTSFHLYLICTNQTTYENFRYHYDRKTNPYNHGLGQNFIEILFSRIPSSKNNFRAKVKEDSAAFTSTLSIGQVLSLPKMSVDREMGMKRQTVAAEELEEIHSQIGSAMGLERCGTEPPHFVGRKGCSEIASDIEAFAEEFSMEHGFTERKKIVRHTNDNP